MGPLSDAFAHFVAADFHRRIPAITSLLDHLRADIDGFWPRICHLRGAVYRFLSALTVVFLCVAGLGRVVRDRQSVQLQL